MRPHVAIIHIQSIIYEKLPDGQISPKRIEFSQKQYSVCDGSLEECKEKIEKYSNLIKESLEG